MAEENEQLINADEAAVASAAANGGGWRRLAEAEAEAEEEAAAAERVAEEGKTEEVTEPALQRENTVTAAPLRRENTEPAQDNDGELLAATVTAAPAPAPAQDNDGELLAATVTAAPAPAPAQDNDDELLAALGPNNRRLQRAKTESALQRANTVAALQRANTVAAAAVKEQVVDEDTEEGDTESKYKNLKKSYNCDMEGKKGMPWESINDEHVQLSYDEIENDLYKILEQFFIGNQIYKERLPNIEDMVAKLKQNEDYKDATSSENNYYFAYGSEWKTYLENSGKSKTNTIKRSKNDIETVKISMLLANVFMIFPDANHLVIACRADNNYYRLKDWDKTISTSSTPNTKAQINDRYTQGTSGASDTSGASGASGVLDIQRGGNPTKFGLTFDYTVEKYIKTLTPIKERSNDTYGYEYTTIIEEQNTHNEWKDDTTTNLRNLLDIMKLHMKGKSEIITNLVEQKTGKNIMQTASQKMGHMDLHIYKIGENKGLANKIFASEKYSTKIVNINFYNSERVLTIGSIYAPNQFEEITSVEGKIITRTRKVADEERINSNPPELPKTGGNLNKKQLRNKLNTMSMKELRKLHKEENISTNSNRSIKGLVNNYMKYHNDSNN